MPRKRIERFYARNRNGTTRFYGDFRDYHVQGGGQEPLIAPGERFATTDAGMAKLLAESRLTELQRLRDSGICINPVEDLTRLGSYIKHHLRKKKGHVTERWLEQQCALHLEVAQDFFGAETRLADISSLRVSAFAEYLALLGSGRKGDGGTEKPLSGPTRRKYLNSLSNLFRRAISEGIRPMGTNPVASLMDKPSTSDQDYRPEWMEVADAALLLYAATIYRRKRPDLAIPYLFEIIATFLLTGGRSAEVLGLYVDDISFERGTVTFWKNQTRRLKNRGSCRVVPLWPQLESVLRAYLRGPHAPKGRLLFPSPEDPEKPVAEFRSALNDLTKLIGWDGLPIRTRLFRHTYCAARLQTLDRGEPVAKWTVACELGHHGHEMVDKVYGHLGRTSHRSSEVEYRIEHFREHLGDRIDEVERRAAEAANTNWRAVPHPKRRVAPESEREILSLTAEYPSWGQRRVARALCDRGITISAAGVRCVWKRHGLATAPERIAMAGGHMPASGYAAITGALETDHQAA